MKKCTGLFIFLVVLILAAYYGLGFMVESTLHKNVNAIPQNPVLNVHLDQYQRGWFSSRAVLAIKMHIPKQMTKDKNGVTKMDKDVDFDLNFPLIINHGPIIFTDNGIRFGIGQVTTQPETHYNVLVNYFNKTIIKYVLPSFVIKGNSPNGEDFQFAWQGLSALIGVSPNLDKWHGNFSLNGFSGSANNVQFNVGEIVNNFNLTHEQDGLWLGQSHLSLPSVTVSASNTPILTLEAFDWLLNSYISGELLNFDCNLSLNKFVVANKTYGPGVFKLSIKNLDPVAMASIHKLEANMLQNNQDPNLLMVSLLAELPKLLSKGAEVELSEMNFNLPEGKVIGNFKISLPKEDFSDPMQLLQKAHGEGQLKAPIALVKTLMTSSITNNINKQAQKTAAAQPSTQASAPGSTTTTAASADATTTAPADATTTTAPADAATTSAPADASTTSAPADASTTAAPADTTTVATNTTEEAQKQTDQILQNLVSKGLLKVEGNDYVVIFTLENQKFNVNGKPFNPDVLN